MSLSSKEREIAIQAIGARATGSPADAARQILEGIAILNGLDKPFLIWPDPLSCEEKIEALDSELKRLRHAARAVADWRATQSSYQQQGLNANPECPGNQIHAEAFGAPATEAVDQAAHDAATVEGHLLSAQMLAQGASDASQ